MGIEAFGTSMDFVEADDDGLVRKYFGACPMVHLEQEQRNPDFETTTAEYSDGSHIIDFQLSRDSKSNRSSLAIRFSLCSYDTIDSIFVGVVSKVLSSWDAEVWLMTSALRQKERYLPGDSQWLLAALPAEIIAMREYWQRLFGLKQGAVRVKDSFSFVGLEMK